MLTTGGGALHTFQTLILLLLVFVAVFAGMARRLQIPYPIVLVIAGLLLSLAPGVPRVALSPDLVFLVFLPPLLYAAAWTLSWQEFKKNLVSIGWLAFGLVVVTVAAAALFAGSLLPGFDWKAGFLLGAVVAATDPIAATATARRMGLPQSIAHLLEAESLVNDGTGLLALQFGLLILVQGHAPGVIEGFGRLIYLTGAGVAIGGTIGGIVAWFERWVDDGPVEIVISLLVPYFTYLAGNAFHASGVLAVIACGMVMSNRSSGFLSGSVRLQVDAVWESLTFILNGLVFILIGLQLPYVLGQIHGMRPLALAAYGFGFSAFLIVLRLVWVFTVQYGRYWLPRWLGDPQRTDHEPMPKPRLGRVFLVGWTGLRGVLSLTAAVALPEVLPGGRVFPQRNIIVYLAFCVILTTLVLQGLTLPALIRRLGLRDEDDASEEQQEARRFLLVKALDKVERLRVKSAREMAPVYQELEAVYQNRLATMPRHRPGSEATSVVVLQERRRSAMLDAFAAERAALADLRDDGSISDDTARLLQREIDLAESRVHSSGSLL